MYHVTYGSLGLYISNNILSVHISVFDLFWLLEGILATLQFRFLTDQDHRNVLEREDWSSINFGRLISQVYVTQFQSRGLDYICQKQRLVPTSVFDIPSALQSTCVFLVKEHDMLHLFIEQFLVKKYATACTLIINKIGKVQIF